MKIKLISLMVTMFLTANMSVLGFETKCMTVYDSTQNAFIIKGNLEYASRVLLMVYSPVENSDLRQIYYMESQTEVYDSYSFIVKMSNDVPMGAYDFHVTVYGGIAAEYKTSFDYPVISSGEYDITNISAEGNFTAGGSVTGKCVVNKNSDKQPLLLMTLFNKSSGSDYVENARLTDLGINIDDSIVYTITFDELPEDIENYYIKIMAWSDITSMKPVAESIEFFPAE